MRQKQHEGEKEDEGFQHIQSKYIRSQCIMKKFQDYHASGTTKD